MPPAYWIHSGHCLPHLVPRTRVRVPSVCLDFHVALLIFYKFEVRQWAGFQVKVTEACLIVIAYRTKECLGGWLEHDGLCLDRILSVLTLQAFQRECLCKKANSAPYHCIVRLADRCPWWEQGCHLLLLIVNHQLGTVIALDFLNSFGACQGYPLRHTYVSSDSALSCSDCTMGYQSSRRSTNLIETCTTSHLSHY